MLNDYLLTSIESAGVLLCLFLATALLYLPGNHRAANRWLGLLFLVFALVFAYMVLRQNDLLALAPLASFLRLPLLFLYGPLLYLYLDRITSLPEPGSQRSALPHLLVFALALLAYLPSLLLDHGALLQIIYASNDASLDLTQRWLWLLTTRVCMPSFVLHLGVYLLLCLHLLLRHKQRVRQYFSRLDQVSLDWLRNLLLAFAGLWLVVALRQLLFAQTSTGALLETALVPLLVLFLSALGLFGLLQKQIPLPPPEGPDSEPLPAGSGSAKYPHSTLTEAQRQAVLDQLLALMVRDKPYLDSELSLTALAASLGLPARHLSQAINGSLGQHFLDFVNSYRVEEAKRLLADHGNNSSILAIAMDVGFNSKSAFYNAFKRHAGQTPTAYRSTCRMLSAPDVQA